jgi:predicted amidohydrolase
LEGTRLKIAVVQFEIKEHFSDANWWNDVENWMVISQKSGAELILFPEYFTIGLALCTAPAELGFRSKLDHFARWESGSFQQKFQHLAESYGIAVVAGSAPFLCESGDGTVLNRSCVFLPKSQALYQDKLQMTRFETEEWNVSAPKVERQLVKFFEWKGFLCAVAIWYDVEFPDICSRAALHGAHLLLVPSCTDSVQGYWRVRHCAQARAVEQQCYVALAGVVGGVSQFEEVAQHYSRSGVFTPCDEKFPEGGVAEVLANNSPGLVAIDLSLEVLNWVREEGAVLNLKDFQNKQT